MGWTLSRCPLTGVRVLDFTWVRAGPWATRWLEVFGAEIIKSGATLYNGSPWCISRRAPLIGEHNEEIFCGELGVPKAELTLLAESGVI